MQLNREQVNQILNAAPMGTDKKKILDGLVVRGYQLEGVDSDAIKKSLTSPETKNSFGSETMGDIKQVGGEISSSVKDRSKNIQQITSDVSSGKINPIRGGFQTAGQVAGGVADVIGSTLKGAVKTVLPDKAEQDISQVVQKFGAKVVAIPEVQKIINDYNALPPEKQRDIDAVGGIVNLVSTFIGGKGATVAGEAIGTGAKTVGKGVKNSITSGVETVTSKIATTAESASPQIMNKVARLTPTQANKFKQIAGMTHGEYLAKTGNFANPEKIITNEATKFAQSVKAVDETLASLPGKYKNGAINDALDSLVKKAQSVSTDSVKSPYLKEATSLLKKANTEGLTMEEMNQAKRLFEKNVKLGYNKMLNPKEVELATNIDNAVREFQFKTAKKLGFKNLDEMNEQTQISRELVNSLGKQLTGKTGLNDVSLTDWIMLSGGDPTAVGGLLTKKLFGNKTVQARIAKMLNKTKPTGQINPVVKSSKLKSQPLLETQSGKPYTKDIPQTSKKGEGAIPKNSLVSEAKKYKSAEEFEIKNDLVFQGVGKGKQSQYFTTDIKEAQGYANQKGLKGSGEVRAVKWSDIPDDVKTINADESIAPIVREALGENAIGRVLTKEEFGKIQKHIYLPKDIPTTTINGSLTDIWNKANKK